MRACNILLWGGDTDEYVVIGVKIVSISGSICCLCLNNSQILVIA